MRVCQWTRTTRAGNTPKEPQILHIPYTKGRYYLVPLVSA